MKKEKKIKLERTTVNIYVENEEELYNRFDNINETLSDEVINYLENKIKLIPIYNMIDIEIDSKKEIDLDKFKNAYKTYIDNELVEKNKKSKINNMIKVKLLIIGLLFVILSIILKSKLDTILIEIISIIGSFSLWEVSDLVLVENSEIKFNKLNLKRKSLCEITNKVIK